MPSSAQETPFNSSVVLMFFWTIRFCARPRAIDTMARTGFPSARDLINGPRPPYETSTKPSKTALIAATPPWTGVQITSRPSSSQRPSVVAAAQDKSSTPKVGPDPAARRIGNFSDISTYRSCLDACRRTKCRLVSVITISSF